MAAEFISSPAIQAGLVEKITAMTNDDLRQFALACYAQPGVESACLELQAAGADVCLLLAGAWLERRAIACTVERMAQLRKVADEWQAEVTTPLRSLRQAWRESAKSDGALRALRERVKQLELDAEYIQLDRLQQVTRPWPAEQKSVDWLAVICAPLGGDVCAPLEKLRRAALSLEPGQNG